MATKMPGVRSFGGRTPTGISRLIIALIVGVALALLLVVMMQASPRPAYAASDRLPDLRMARLQNLQIETSNGRKLLRFDSIIVNVGAGPFEARGSRPDTNTAQMRVTQRIFDDAGGHRNVATPAKMYYSGDGHNHWHVRDLQQYELIRVYNGVKVRTGAKHGFCFYDNYNFGSTRDRFYTRDSGACGERSDLRVKMGLSRGWGDIYRSRLPDQYIDITGLPPGKYRMRATADAANWFSESNNTNNFTWVDIKISGNSVSVKRYGPSAQPI
jgi:lysyl oxidase